MTKFSRRALWIFAGLITVLLVALIVLRVAVGWYLRSDAFRAQIAGAANHALKADGDFMPLQYAGGTFYSDGFTARGTPDAFFSNLRADQIRAIFNWRGLLSRKCQIDELTVQNVDLRFAERTARESQVVRPGNRPAAMGATKWRLDLRKASVAQSSWQWAGGGITQSAFTLEPNGDSWVVTANTGKVSQNGWPDLSIESAHLRYNGSSLFVNESSLRTGTGRIGVSGEVDFAHSADLKVQFEDVPITPLLTPDWRLRLNGKLAGTTSVHAPLPTGALHVEGNLNLIDGQLEALPLLDQIATFTRTERFRRVMLTRGSMSFTRDTALVTAKDIVLESEGLMRVEGACTIVNDQIEGVFQIGVTAASLQWLPGSQSRVFTIAHDGYFWTPLRLTGPVAHPNEDLTQRLVAAAAGELLQNTQDTVRDTAKTLLDLLPH